MRLRFIALAVVAAVVVPTSIGTSAPRNEKVEVARDLATRVGQILGAATACRDIARPRIKNMHDRFMDVLRSAASTADELTAIKQSYDRSIGEGQRAIASRRIECLAADRELAELESAVTAPQATAPATGRRDFATDIFPGSSPTTPALSGVPSGISSFTGTAQAAPPLGRVAPSAQPPVGALPVQLPQAAAALIPPAPVPQTSLLPNNVNIPRGVTVDEIRFGIAAPFSGATKELGHHMRLGIETGFNEANANGGVNGRMLRLIAADDGYEPTRTADAMKQLYETDQVFGTIGNVGTPTAAVSLPFALEHRMLFYGAFTGANLLRRDPPDRYVFNYRASYAEETDAVVRYLVKLRRLRPEQIAVFAQEDAYGDAGFAGVAKAMRVLRGGSDPGNILRLNYKRNTVDVDEAVTRLRQSKIPIKAVVMVATYRAAAKFIEKTHDSIPGLVYTNVSFVGSTALAEELMLLGPRFANGVIVTQVVPAVESYASVILEYKAALAASFPGEAPDYVSLEGYLATKVLVEALRRAGPQLDTEKVVDALESLRDFDIGLGAPLSFSRTEHQALHKVWGTQLDANGRYQPIELQ